MIAGEEGMIDIFKEKPEPTARFQTEDEKERARKEKFRARMAMAKQIIADVRSGVYGDPNNLTPHDNTDGFITN